MCMRIFLFNNTVTYVIIPTPVGAQGEGGASGSLKKTTFPVESYNEPYTIIGLVHLHAKKNHSEAKKYI